MPRPSAVSPTFAWLLAFVACGTPPAPSAPREAAPPPTPPTAPTEADRWGVVSLSSVPVVIALYDPARWRKTGGGTFTTLEHPASRSTLALRVWPAARLVRPAECDAEARLSRPTLPKVDPESTLDSRSLEAPEGFNGSLVVGVEPGPNGSLRGFVLAVGASVGRCFVLAFETSADGIESANVIGDRLRAVSDRVAPSVEVPNVDERVRPEREP